MGSVRTTFMGILLAAAIGSAQQRPAIDLWRFIRTELSGPKSEEFFKSIKGASTPPEVDPHLNGTFGGTMFEGKVLSQPSRDELVLDVDDPRGDAMLHFEPALKGAIPVSTVVHFKGVVASYTDNPYVLTLEAGTVTGIPIAAIPRASRRPR